MNHELKCPVCGDPADKPWLSALHHFRLYSSGGWKYLRGNIQTFGFWPGLSGTLGLAFPIYNTLKNWKYRKCRISIEKHP